jgi:hypothetical protein
MIRGFIKVNKGAGEKVYSVIWTHTRKVTNVLHGLRSISACRVVFVTTDLLTDTQSFSLSDNLTSTLLFVIILAKGRTYS